ncbi:F-box/LRR-repeat protein At3g48880-like [Vitis vinifera]|nr:F-box/LRR-repeat protein At3g48880-like [Vitis vinifera]|eukprot:XP_010654933.1 PREDICTED: F-box/LRR-repeat protein At3g48880-like [Vitis vinifera]
MDCLINIFERLELQELILGVAFVCKSWHRASVSPQCWKTLNMDKLNFAPSSSPFVTTFCHQYAIHNFSVSGFLTLALSRGGPAVVELILPAICTLEKLIYASNMCPCLRVLGLPMHIVKHNNSIDLFSDEEMTQFLGLFNKWKDLEYLHLREYQSYTREVLLAIKLHCKNFVGIKKIGLMGDDEASAIAAVLPGLKQLTVTSSATPALMIRESLKEILEGCRELEVLVINDCCGFEVDEEILKMTSHIRSFLYKDVRPNVDEDYYPLAIIFNPDTWKHSGIDLGLGIDHLGLN